MLQTSFFFSLTLWHTQTQREIVISIWAQWPSLGLVTFRVQPSNRYCQHNRVQSKVGECLWSDSARAVKEPGDKAVFVINAIKGTSNCVLWHREFIEASSHLLLFIVQFIRLATWSVRANPVTAQQKAKLRGVRGCRTGRLTGWLTPFPRRIASCQSWSCHLDRNPFFGCNLHSQPFCHSRPHRHTNTHLFPFSIFCIEPQETTNKHPALTY